MLISGKPNTCVADKTAADGGAESELVAAGKSNDTRLTIRCFAGVTKFPGRSPTTRDIARSQDDAR